MTGSRSATDPRAVGRIRLAGLAAALLAALLILGIGGERTARPVFDVMNRLAPRDLSRTDVRVVAIDDAAIKAIGPWPWPRDLVALLVDRLGAEGATVIAIDSLFVEEDRLNPGEFGRTYEGALSEGSRAEIARLPRLDDALAAAFGRNPVVLARAGTDEAPPLLEGEAPREAGALPVEARFTAPLPAGWQRFDHATANIAALDDLALGHGLINGAPDSDGAVRRLPAAAAIGGTPTPGFAVEIARLMLEAEALTPTPAGLRVGGRTIPVDAAGWLHPRFGALPLGDILSAATFMGEDRPRGRLAGKAVIVGLTAGGTNDIAPTPLEPATFGVEIHAQAVDAILRGGLLARPAWIVAAEWVAATLLALLILWLGPTRRRATLALAAGLLAALAASAFAAYLAGGLLLDPAKAASIGAAALAGVLAMVGVEAYRAQQRLQITAARSAGELQAARDIQFAMLPQRDALARLHPRLDIDAVIEPARSVGGDFYDAVPLAGDRVGFIVGDVTGKGVPASLFMALSKAMAKSAIMRDGADLADAAERLDVELSRENAADMGVTMLIGAIDTASGQVTLCNAGHENPLRVARAGQVVPFDMEGGPPFCVADGFPYPAETIRLSPGESLVLVTDGVTEAQNRAGELFGTERLSAALAGVPAGAGARQTTDALLAAVRAFEDGAPASDDLTLMVLRYNG